MRFCIPTSLPQGCKGLELCLDVPWVWRGPGLGLSSAGSEAGWPDRNRCSNMASVSQAAVQCWPTTSGFKESVCVLAFPRLATDQSSSLSFSFFGLLVIITLTSCDGQLIPLLFIFPISGHS